MCHNNDLERQVRLMQGTKPYDCQLSPAISQGVYTDTRLIACLPNREQLLGMLDSNRQRACETWRIFMRRTSNQKRVGLPVYMYTYIFDAAVAAQPAFNRQQPPKTNMVGCHWLLAHVFDDHPETIDNC